MQYSVYLVGCRARFVLCGEGVVHYLHALLQLMGSQGFYELLGGVAIPSSKTWTKVTSPFQDPLLAHTHLWQAHVYSILLVLVSVSLYGGYL